MSFRNPKTAEAMPLSPRCATTPCQALARGPMVSSSPMLLWSQPIAGQHSFHATSLRYGERFSNIATYGIVLVLVRSTTATTAMAIGKILVTRNTMATRKTVVTRNISSDSFHIPAYYTRPLPTVEHITAFRSGAHLKLGH